MSKDLLKLLQQSIPDVALAIQNGQVSARELALSVLERIQVDDTGSYLDVDAERTLAQADRVDTKRIQKQPLGPLAGIPIGIKDALCTMDAPTTCASKILEGYRPPYDATVVARLRQADAVFTGKLNMDEFAMGSSNENSAFKPVKNPHDKTRVAGGSSGGSAAAVAAHLAMGTLGSDTGGSVRQPAALCGVVGIKPTYGLVSRYGLIAFASSLDQVGVFARDVRGAACLLETIAGHDSFDSTSAQRLVTQGEFSSACGKEIKGLRVGIPNEYFSVDQAGAGLEPDVRQSVEEALRRLESLGCTLVPISLPHTRYAVPTYYVIATAEASSNLARFDGVRYGLRIEKENDLEAMYGATRDMGFGPEVKRRILLGTYVLSAGYYDAYYTKAQKVRTLIGRDFSQAFEHVDVIAGPTSPQVAWPLGAKINDPLTMYLTDVYTLPGPLAGIPGVSIPIRPNSQGLPIGFQLMGPAFSEARLIAMAHALESSISTKL